MNGSRSRKMFDDASSNVIKGVRLAAKDFHNAMGLHFFVAKKKSEYVIAGAKINLLNLLRLVIKEDSSEITTGNTRWN